MTEQNIKSKTELFRFATLRKPKTLDADAKVIGFVTNLDPASSHFLTKLQEAQTLKEARAKLPSLAKSFKRIRRVEGIRKLNSSLFNFSGWLMQHRSHLRGEKLDSIMQGVNVLTSAQRSKIWDNLYADLVEKSSPPIRQTCLQMLVADHFILNENSADQLGNFSRQPGSQEMKEDRLKELYLRRLAHASVAVHYVFGKTAEETNEENKDDRFPEFLREEQNRFLLGEEIRHLEQLSLDVKQLSTTYESDKLIIQIDTEAAHKADVDIESSKYNKANGLTGLNLEGRLKINPDTLPELKLPQSKFKFPDPMSEKYFSDKVQVSTGFFLKGKVREGKDIDNTLRDINNRLSEAKKGLYRTGSGSKKRVRLAGKVYGIKDARDYIFTIGFRQDPSTEENRDIIYLTFCPGNQSLFVRSMRYGVKIEGYNERRNTEFKEKKRSKRAIFLRLFPDNSIPIQDGTIYKFRAEMELSDGNKFKLELESQKGLDTTWGTAQLIGPDIQTSDLMLPFEKVDVYGVNRVGIADYRLVEQEVCCYIPGEVSHIENIMAREYKERHTRSLTSTETTIESEIVLETENQSDTSTSERNELNTEIASILAEDKSNSAGISTGVSGSYMGVEMSLDAGVDFATSNSSSDSNTMAKNYALEVTKAATERVLQKITEKRVARVLQEYEENNRHGFDNRSGDQHVTGVFRWVDKVMTNRLVNYGKRLVYEFMIPEPSKFYRQAIEIESEEVETPSSASVLEEPVHPKNLNPPIASADDIDRDNYKEVGANYEFTPDAPMDDQDFLDANYSQGNLKKKEYGAAQMPPVTIPTGYKAVKTTGTLTYDWEAKPPINDGGAYINITFGGKTYNSGTKEGSRSRVTIPNTFSLNGQTYEIPGLNFNHGDKTGTMTCSVSCNKLFSFNIGLSIEIRLKDEIYEQWKADTYAAIMSAYESKKTAYDASLEQEAAANAMEDEDQTMEIAASMYRGIEQTELKRLAIEMLTRPFGIRQGRDFTGIDNCGVPKVIQNQNLENYSSHVKFFEQAFDWSIMSYLFYPYYWAKKCDWVELFQAQSGSDEIFSSFLQSGMARMTVPVRLGFEKALTYYMSTGEIWMGGDLVLETDDDLYLSIAEELEVIEGQVEEEWETILPTTLTIIQDDSAGLDAGGLPCCDDVDAGKTGLVVSESKLKRLEIENVDSDG
ncbi:hypothetical protein [Muriicola sp. Z0-33]|uniref:hypothetical protein n=1 Tax=Muriicola sp. Z0-33 TaxID=2816957 RepID=UPI002238E09F|nr:hypothetical protein [Muriicola sp. Z0-33]MCW5517470.1 hypothetical protein [Muriicola sp. Z0-33]